MIYTKEQLIGRKMRAAPNGTGQVNYLYDNPGTDRLYISIKSNLTPSQLKQERNLGNWSIDEIVEYLNKGSWKLLPEEPKVYTTPKGIKYGIGTKFNTDIHQYQFTNDKATKHLAFKALTGSVDMLFTDYSQEYVERMFDSDKWTIIQDYQQVDPSTITFDFTNTRIRVNSPEESEWIQKVAFNNGWSWLGNSQMPEHTKSNHLFFEKVNAQGRKSIMYSASEGHYYYRNSLHKEITIQDILNNQMEEAIEVGDIVEILKIQSSRLNLKTEYVVHKVDKNTIYIRHPNNDTWANIDWRFDIKNIKLISKANKQEIIGYELLKDLPGIPAGTKYTEENNEKGWFNANGLFYYQRLPLSQVQDTTWFKPIYEPKEVVVKISKGREVKVYSTHIEIQVEGRENSIFKKDIEKLYKLLTAGNKLETTGDSVWDITIEVFKVGCQEFTKEDIEVVYQAVKSFN